MQIRIKPQQFKRIRGLQFQKLTEQHLQVVVHIRSVGWCSKAKCLGLRWPHKGPAELCQHLLKVTATQNKHLDMNLQYNLKMRESHYLSYLVNLSLRILCQNLTVDLTKARRWEQDDSWSLISSSAMHARVLAASGTLLVIRYCWMLSL